MMPPRLTIEAWLIGLVWAAAVLASVVALARYGG